MKLKFFLATTIFSTVAFANVQAADVVKSKQAIPAMTVPAFSWAGFYFGVQGGYGFGSQKDTVAIVDANRQVYGSVSQSQPKGWMGGVFTGFNFYLANGIVFGAETDLNLGKQNNDNLVRYVDSQGQIAPAFLSLKTSENWNGATRIRLGYPIDRFMPYVAAGITYAKLEADGAFVSETNTSIRKDARTESNNFIGWTIGAGVDYAALDNVMLRLEYRYNNYGEEKNIGDSYLRHVSYSTNHLRIGVAYKF